MVLVILGVLASLVTLKVSNSARWADLKSCKANWNLIYNANLQYQNDLSLPDDSNLTYLQKSSSFYDLKTLASKGYFDSGDSNVDQIATTGISKAHNCDMQLINGVIYLLNSDGQGIPIKDIETLNSPSSLQDVVSLLPTINEPIGGFSISGSGSGTITGTKLDQVTNIYFKSSVDLWPGREGSISKTSDTTSIIFNAASGKYQSAQLILKFLDGTYWYSKNLYTFG